MRNKLKIILLILLIFLSVLSCATYKELTLAGATVEYQEKGEPPKNAELLGTVQTNDSDSAVSAINDLRNKAAELGGNFLIVDIISSSIRENFLTGLVETIYSASGRVYKRK